MIVLIPSFASGVESAPTSEKFILSQQEPPAGSQVPFGQAITFRFDFQGYDGSLPWNISIFDMTQPNYYSDPSSLLGGEGCYASPCVFQFHPPKIGNNEWAFVIYDNQGRKIGSTATEFFVVQPEALGIPNSQPNPVKEGQSTIAISNLKAVVTKSTTDLSANIPGVTRVTIDWGDGTITQNGISEYIHTYSQPGTYVIKLTAYDANGFSASAETTAVISLNSMAITGLNATITGHTVNLYGNIIPSQGATTNRVTIDWGDGTSTQNGLKEYIHTYSRPDTYIITITGYDTNGFSVSASKTLVIPSVESSYVPTVPQPSTTTPSETSSPASQGISNELLLTIIGLIMAAIAIPLGLYFSRKSEKKIVDKIEKSVGNIEDKVVRNAMGTINKDIENLKEESRQDVKKTVNKLKDALDDVSKDL